MTNGEFIAKDDSFEAVFGGVGYGLYTITAFSGDWTSESALNVVVTQDHPSVSGTLRLRKRPLRISVTDQDGKAVENATIRASVLRIDEPGNDDLYDGTSLPAGQEMTISSPGFLPTCVHVSPDAHQDVELHKLGSHSVMIVLAPSPQSPFRIPRRVVGVLQGLPGAECAVSIRELRIRDVVAENAQEVAARITGLPTGEYIFRVEEQGPGLTIGVPGKPVRYIVPDFCRFCG